MSGTILVVGDISKQNHYILVGISLHIYLLYVPKNEALWLFLDIARVFGRSLEIDRKLTVGFLFWNLT